MFVTQTIATILGALMSVVVTDWVIDNIPELCTKDQPSHFTCPGTHTFFSASVIWVHSSLCIRCIQLTTIGTDRSETHLWRRRNLSRSDLGVSDRCNTSYSILPVHHQKPKIMDPTRPHPRHSFRCPRMGAIRTNLKTL